MDLLMQRVIIWDTNVRIRQMTCCFEALEEEGLIMSLKASNFVIGFFLFYLLFSLFSDHLIVSCCNVMF